MNVSQTERQLYILSWLSDSKIGCTIEELENKLCRVGINVSRRTIERDIDVISASNFFVMEERRDRKIYYIANKFGIRNITFTPSELISLHFIREILRSYSALDIGNTSMQLIKKIIEDLPEPDKKYLETLSKLFKVKKSYDGMEKCLDEETVNIIKSSIDAKRSVFIKYQSFKDEKMTERKFDPYIIEIYGGCYHVIGYCHLRGSVRDLRLARIADIKVLDDTYEIPDNFYQNYKKSRFEKLAGEEEINLTLRFSDEAARFVREYERTKADTLTEQEDGSLLFRKSTTMTPEIIKWVLGFGAGVEVIEPDVLREAVIEQISGMAERYKR